ncbi:MAG: PAS domain S-box protein [Deltaproteobacteria bacterium]|nr:PAS domain S-box protein [Deltaproteobacteria bacterium]
MIDTNEQSDSFSAVLVSPHPQTGLRTFATAFELPPDANIVVVDCRESDPRTIFKNIREHAPAAHIIAWVKPKEAAKAAELLSIGYYDIVYSLPHLKQVLSRENTTQNLEWRLVRQLNMNAGLLQIISEIARKPDLQDVLQLSVSRISELFSIERVSVVVFDQQNQEGFVVMEREQETLANIAIKVNDYPELQQIINTKEPLIIADVFADNLLAGVRGKITQAHQPPRAAVLFPLIRKDQVVGALFLRSEEPMGELDDQLLAMGHLISSTTAIAIGHALEHDMLLSEKKALQRSKAWVDEQLIVLKELRDFLDQAKDGVLITDVDGVIRYANATAASLMHQTLEELPSRRFRDFLLPHCHALSERALRGDAVGDENGYVDLIVGTSDDIDIGSIVISAAIRPLASPEGVVISFRDVTALREIESELRQTKEFLENLIQSSVDAIIATDTDGSVILFNRAAEQMLGYTAREMVGRANMSVFYPRGEAWDVMKKLRSEAYGGRGRLQMVRKELIARNGETVPVNLTAAIIYEGNREVATVSILSDLRERRRIEEKLSQVQRKLQLTERQAVAVELAGAAAHELNQPLTSIMGYAELLRRKCQSNESEKKAVDIICKEVERMAAIVRKIGQITAYQTKPYIGGSQILDLSDSPPVDVNGDMSEVKK